MPVPEAPAGKTDDEISRLARSGQKIAAIKLMRERTGMGLREAKEAVEAIAAGAPLPEEAATTGSGAGGFRMTVDDVFSIAGRGTVITGTVEQGVLRVGDDVLVVKPDGAELAAECSGLEMFRRTLNEAHAGDHVGVLLKGLGKEQLARGDVLRSPTPGQPSASRASGSALAEILQSRGINPGHPRVEEEVVALVRQGERIPAIKALRDHVALELKDAKDVVDELGSRLGAHKPSGKCFIATAACGTASAEAVVTLRRFREAALRPTPMGRAFIRCYERVAPPVSEAVAASRVLQVAVRHGVVSPAAWAAGLWLRIAGRSGRPPRP